MNLTAFDVDYQVTYNPKRNPAVKLKVKEDKYRDMIKVVDAWV